jgi:hypothetical protein
MLLYSEGGRADVWWRISQPQRKVLEGIQSNRLATSRAYQVLAEPSTISSILENGSDPGHRRRTRDRAQIFEHGFKVHRSQVCAGSSAPVPDTNSCLAHD